MRPLGSYNGCFCSTLAMDVTANCICEIHCLALDGFNLNSVHKLSSKEKKSKAEPGIKPRAAGWEAIMLPLCYAAPYTPNVKADPQGRSVKTIQFGCSSVLSTNWMQVKFSQWRIACNKKGGKFESNQLLLLLPLLPLLLPPQLSTSSRSPQSCSKRMGLHDCAKLERQGFNPSTVLKQAPWSYLGSL